MGYVPCESLVTTDSGIGYGIFGKSYGIKLELILDLFYLCTE